MATYLNDAKKRVGGGGSHRRRVTQMCLVLRPSARHYALILDTESKPHAPSDTGTGARWAASGWNTPLAAQWADSRIAWREEMREESREAVVIP